MKFKLFFNCEEANHVCDKAQYKEASFSEKILLNIHNLFCRLCKEHSARNTKLTKTIQKSQLESLSLKEKNDLKKSLGQKIA